MQILKNKYQKFLTQDKISYNAHDGQKWSMHSYNTMLSAGSNLKNNQEISLNNPGNILLI